MDNQLIRARMVFEENKVAFDIEDVMTGDKAHISTQDERGTVYIDKQVWKSTGGCGTGYTKTVAVPLSQCTAEDVAEMFMNLPRTQWAKFPPATT